MRLLVCVLLLSGALCAALPAEYVQYLINGRRLLPMSPSKETSSAARDGELSNMETPREYAFYRITRNDVSFDRPGRG